MSRVFWPGDEIPQGIWLLAHNGRLVQCEFGGSHVPKEARNPYVEVVLPDYHRIVSTAAHVRWMAEDKAKFLSGEIDRFAISQEPYVYPRRGVDVYLIASRTPEDPLFRFNIRKYPEETGWYGGQILWGCDTPGREEALKIAMDWVDEGLIPRNCTNQLLH